MPTVDFTRRTALQSAALMLGAGPMGAAHARPARDALQIVGPWEIGGLSPSASGHIFTRLQVTETLVDVTDDGRLGAGLARNWTVSDDGLIWRFVLASGCHFHDGTPVSAEAVLPSLRLAQQPPGLLSQAGIVHMAAEDARTVRIELARPHAPLGALLTHSSTCILSPRSIGDNHPIREIVGTGPYRVTRLAAPQHVETAWASDGRHPAPAVRSVRYLAAGRAETRALMVEGGQADLAYNLDLASLLRLQRRPQIRIASTVLPRVLAVKVNAGLPLLSDVRVRQALSLSVDRSGIAHALLRAPELAATQLLPPSLTDWHQASLPPLGHDPARARALLEAAGWRRRGRHWLDPQGLPVTLTLRTFPDRPELPWIATALQAQWRELGIDIRVAIGNSGDIPLGHRDGSLQLALIARNYGTTADPLSTLMQDFGDKGGDWGAMGWHSARLTAAWHRLSGENLRPHERLALQAQAVNVLHESLPVIPLAWYRQQVAVGQRLQGVTLDPLERSYRLTRISWTP